MTRSDLPQILRVAPATVTRFLKDVCPQYITVEEDGTMFANQSLFLRGTTGNMGGDFQRFFVAGVRNLYNRTPINQHNQLGYVYKMLPYINREYNILCRNSDEEILENVECISDTEFCEMIGYSVENTERLMRSYRSIRFTVDDHTELFLSHVNGKFFVNPNILYIGKHFENVKILGFFCNTSR